MLTDILLVSHNFNSFIFISEKILSKNCFMLEVLALNGGVLAMDGEELVRNVISFSLLELLITVKN